MRLDRRTLLATLATLAGGTLLGSRAGAQDALRPLAWRNWGGNLSCQPGRIVVPESEDALLALLRADRTPLRAVGTGHSWTPLVPTEGTLLSVDRMSGLVAHDVAQQIGGGTYPFPGVRLAHAFARVGTEAEQHARAQLGHRPGIVSVEER